MILIVLTLLLVVTGLAIAYAIIQALENGVMPVYEDYEEGTDESVSFAEKMHIASLQAALENIQELAAQIETLDLAIESHKVDVKKMAIAIQDAARIAKS